jgi:hypothetical protein
LRIASTPVWCALPITAAGQPGWYFSGFPLIASLFPLGRQAQFSIRADPCFQLGQVLAEEGAQEVE